MKPWICDTCGEEIKDSSHGWVEWLKLSQESPIKAKGFRLVHSYPHSPLKKRQQRCQYDERYHFKNEQAIVSDTDLESFMGNDGLTRFLLLIKDNELPQEEIFDMMYRIKVPGYEQAREYFSEAMSEGVFEPNLPNGFYSEQDIEATLEYIKRNNSDA